MSQAEFARALLDPSAPIPPGLRAWNGSDPMRRFAVHRNNVVVSLANALADTFPVVRALVGPDFFAAMAQDFIRAQPPRSPVLADFGEAFPDFIGAFLPAAGVPYLADVARLEQARVQACHAADAPSLSMPLLQSMLLSVGEVQGLRLHPSARLVESAHPVFSIWAAHQGAGELESIDLAQPQAVLVLRPWANVVCIPMHPAAASFVAELLRGQGLGDAANRAAGEAGFDLAATLASLVVAGAVIAVDP